MIRLIPHPTQFQDEFELRLRSTSKELVELLKELQVAKKWGYAQGISAVDVMIAIAELDKASHKLWR